METTLDNPFPLNAFPPRMRSFVTTAKETLNFPIPYTASSMLLVFSLAIGNTRVLKVKDGWTVVISKYIFDIFSQSCFDTSVVLFATHLS